MTSLRDLSIEVESLDWKRLLSCWKWLLQDRELAPLAMTSFGDWFLRDAGGAVHLLDLVSGELRPIAATVAEFNHKASLQENLDDWFISELVLLLRERGILLREGECYSYKVPPVVGGKIEPDNIIPLLHMVHQAVLAQLHERIRGLPPGARITGFEFQEE